MRIITRTMLTVSCSALIAMIGVGQASAQIPNLTPSRVGGTLATRGDGTIVMAVRGNDGSLQFSQRTGSTGVGWSKWDAWNQQNGGSIVVAPVMVSSSSGQMVVLGRGTDNVLYYRQETSAGSKVFAAWVGMRRPPPPARASPRSPAGRPWCAAQTGSWPSTRLT